MSIPTALVEEATGDVGAVDPGIDKTIAVIGCTASGTDRAIALYGSPRAVYDNRGVGPAQRIAGAILKANPADALCVVHKTVTAVPGSFGTPDLSSMAGTAVPVFSGTPLDLFHPYIIIDDDGNDGDGTNIGTDGIRFSASEDGGRTMQGPFSLGTGDSYTFPDTGATITFAPVALTLVAPTNALRTAVLAHFPKTTGTIHGAADSTSDDGIGAVCTSNANAVPLINTIRAAIILHFARGATVHTAADTTSGGTANDDIPAAATTQQEALVLLDALIDVFNIHIVDLSYHGGSGVADAVASPTLVTGDLVTGDIITVDTVAPKWNSDGLTQAFSDLAGSEQNFGLVVVAGPVSAAEAAVVKAGIATLEARGKRVGCLFATRDMSAGESEQEWLDAVKLDYAAFTSDRITRVAAPCRQTIDDGIRVRVYDCNALIPICARLVGFDLVHKSPGEVALGPLEGTSLTDSSGTLLTNAHDEAGGIQGLDDAHFLTLMRLPDPTRARGVYITWPWVAYVVGTGRIQTIMTRRVANKGERMMAAVAFGQLGSAQTYVPGTLPGTGTISAPAAAIIKSQQLAPLRSEGGLKREISNPDDPNLVTVDRNVVVDGEKVEVTSYLNLTAYKYVGKVKIILNVKL